MSRLKNMVLWKSVLLTALCGVGIFGIWWRGLVHSVETQGRARAEDSLAQVRQTIVREFRRAEETGNAFGLWWSKADARLDRPEGLQAVIPFLEKGAIITNLMLSSENGDSACVLRRKDDWNLVLFKAGRNPRRYMVQGGQWVPCEGDDREEYLGRERPWYRFGATRTAPAWTPEAYRYFTSSVAGYTYTVPVRHLDGRLQGVVGVDVSLEELTQLVWERSPTAHTRTFVTDLEGRLLVPPRLEGMQDPRTRFAHQLMPLSPVQKKNLQDGHFAGTPGESPSLLDPGRAYVGAAVLSTFKRSPAMNLYIAIPAADLYTDQRRFALFTFLVALAVVGGVAWTLMDLHHRVIRPMRQLADKASSPSVDHLEPMNFNSDIWELQCVGEKLHMAGRADLERKRLLTQVEHSQRVDSVGVLAPGIVHDVNNQLTMVLGQIGLCRTALESHPELEPHFQAVEGATTRCADMLRALTNFSRPDQGRRELLNLNDLVANAASLLRRVLGPAIHVEENLSHDLPLIFGEPVKLQQVLVNLGLNARDAMPGGGWIWFRTSRTDGKACLEVEDTGCGMTEAVKRRIFEPFFTTKDPGKGTGLGLAMVANIVATHGGEITVVSEPGAGTCLRIEFPPTLRKQRTQPDVSVGAGASG